MNHFLEILDLDLPFPAFLAACFLNRANIPGDGPCLTGSLVFTVFQSIVISFLGDLVNQQIESQILSIEWIN